MQVLAIILCSIVGGQVQADPAAAPGSGSPPAPGGGTAISDGDFARLLEELGHPRYSVREKAAEALESVPLERLPELMKRFLAERQYEVKRQLRCIIEKVFYREEMAGEPGFLGIQCTARSDVPAPTTGQAVEAVDAVKVLPGFSAERAGMKDRDLIVGFDGRPVGEIFANPPVRPAPPAQLEADPRRIQIMQRDPRIEAFTTTVKRVEPGREVSVLLLRTGPPAEQMLGAVVEDPTQVSQGALFQQLPQQPVIVHRVLPGTPAMAFGLRPLDVILAVNGEKLDAQKNPGEFERALRAAKKGERLVVTVRRQPLEPIELTVKLGRRPVDLVNPDDGVRIRERFAAWWKEHGGGELTFHPPGTLARRDSRWAAPAQVAEPETGLIP